MAVIAALVARNVKVFLRDRTAVFFSLLSVFIIIGLYIFFLGELQVSSIKSSLGEVAGIRFLIDSWIMAGIIIVNTVTVPLGVLGRVVLDEENKLLRDFLVSPITRPQLIAGYIIAAWLVGFLMCLLNIVLAEAYIVIEGGRLLPLAALAKVVGLAFLSVVCSSALMFFFISFTRSMSAFSTLSTIVGTIIGFLTGIYIPIGVLPAAVQSVIKLVPASYGAALMRQFFMQVPLSQVFGHAPTGFLQSYQRDYGVSLFVGGREVTPVFVLAVLVLSGLLFFAFSVVAMMRRKQK